MKYLNNLIAGVLIAGSVAGCTSKYVGESEIYSHHDKSTNCDIRIVGEQYKGDPYSPDYDLFRVEVVCPNSMNISFRMNESSLKNNTHMIIDGKPVSLKKIIEESEK